MYFSFQTDSVSYDAESSRFWAMVLTREWNVREVDGAEVDPDQYFKQRYGIILDHNATGVIIGLEVPEQIYTLLLLQAQ